MYEEDSGDEGRNYSTCEDVRRTLDEASGKEGSGRTKTCALASAGVVA